MDCLDYVSTTGVQSQIVSKEGRDTVKSLLNTVFALGSELLIPSLRYITCQLSHSNRCRESSMTKIESNEPWEALSTVTVDLSVSGPFSAGKQRGFSSEPRPTVDNRVGNDGRLTNAYKSMGYQRH